MIDAGDTRPIETILPYLRYILRKAGGGAGMGVREKGREREYHRI